MIKNFIKHSRMKRESEMRKIKHRNKIVRKLNKRRNQRRRKASSGHKKNTNLKSEIYEAVAPSKFCIDKIIELIKFFQRTEIYCKRNRVKTLKVNLDEVNCIDMYAISLMLSMLNKLSYKNIDYWGTYPKNSECRQFIIDSGFLELVKTNINKPEERKTGNQIFMVGKDCVDSKRIGAAVRESIGYILGTPTIYPPVYDNICEISANSVEHANKNTIEKNWLVSISIEENTLHYILTDTGAGMLSTIRKKFTEKIRDIFLKKDSEVLIDFFKNYYQSATGEINRHKGLPLIYESFKDGFISNLQVITNNVKVDFEKGEALDIGKNYKGVLYSWTVSPENYKKWESSL